MLSLHFTLDEDLARRLQDELNAQKKSRPRRVDLSSTRPRLPLVGVSWSGNIMESRAPVAWKRGNQSESLAQIMEEEQKQQKSENEIVSDF